MTLPKQFQKSSLGMLWRVISAFPGLLIGAGVVLAVLSALSAALFLRLNFDQNRLVSPEVPFFKKYLENLENFGDQEYLFVVIKTGGTEDGKKRAAQFAESLAQRLRRQPEPIRAIYYRISPQELGDGVLLFASPKEAETLTKTIVSLAPFINTWLRDGTLAAFLYQLGSILSNQYGNLPDLDPSVLGGSLNPLRELLKETHHTLAGRVLKKSDFDLTESKTEYFFTSNGELLIMRLLPDKDFSSPDVIGKPLRRVREDLEAARNEFADVEAGLTGRPVLQADEMQTSDKDMTRAAVIAFFLVGLLFMVILHGWLRPLLVLISLTMASAWTFGFATVTVGELNLLSMVFALVLVGIGVDFGVHMVMRYVEAEKTGLGADEAVRTAILRTGPGVILGAITSVCAFYSVLFSDFLGLAELGLIGGSGILLSLLTMLTMLPALLLIAGRKNLFPSSRPRVVAMVFLERLSTQPRRLLLILLSISLLALPGLSKVRFNYNLLELQAKGLESVEYERHLIEASDESTWYAIFTANTLEDVKRRVQTVKRLPSVGTVKSILDFIPEGQKQKVTQYAVAADALAPVSPTGAKPPILDPDALINGLVQLSTALEALQEKLFAAGAGNELALLDRILEHAQSSIGLLEQDPPKAALLLDLQTRLHHSVVESVHKIARLLSVKSVKPEDLPISLRSLYVGKDGRNQIKVTPNEDIWDFANLERFVSDLRQLDPEVSGVPITVLESARLMHRTFLLAAGLTLLLVSLILWFYSRSVPYVLLTLLPLGVGMLWLLELMGWLGLNFNLANFFAIPILIAIGVDGGVHLQARWRELEGRGGLFSTSTPTAVALSFTTTMIGFGGLLFAHHRGLASLGAVMVLGSITCLLACLLVLPAGLKLYGRFSTKET
jgi:hopanoid biosynthesis associated RND transporter like protein HpnN